MRIGEISHLSEHAQLVRIDQGVSMSLKNLCNHNVATIPPDASLADAAARMRTAHVGSLVVVEALGGGLRPVGMLTDRDMVVQALAPNVSVQDLRVADLMSRSLVSVREDGGLECALGQMASAGVRRVPVIGDHGHLIGVLSIDDVLGHLAKQLALVATALQAEQYSEQRQHP
jgi:CBS domain-containing protein